jgi:hypothetical protein
MAPLAGTKAVLAVVLAGAVFSASSRAGATEVGPVEIRGFGTAGYIQTTDPHSLLEYDSNGQKADFSKLTRIGVNLRAPLAPDFEAALQFEARGDQDNFETAVDYGFVSWRALPELSLRAGRLRVPLWLYSQQIDVGISYPWVALPSETYSLTSNMKSGDGISALGRVKLGPGYLQAELMGFEATSDLDVSTPQQSAVAKYTAQDAIAAEVSYEIESSLLLRAGYAQAQTRAEVDAQATFPSQGQGMPPTLQTIPTVLDVGLGQFYSLGAKFALGTWFGSAEWVQRSIAGKDLTNANAASWMAGGNWGRWTGYGSYSYAWNLNGARYSHPDPLVSTLRDAGQTWSLGVNFHAADSVVVKAEYSRAFWGFIDSSHNMNFDIYEASVDFVF